MKIINRKAKYNYQILDKIEAGISLRGAEVKSIKKGQASLSDSYVNIDQNNEAWLINAHVSPYQPAQQKGYDPKRTRKLLLHKKQALSLKKKMEGKNLTIIPTKMYTKRGIIKLEIALARGKKKWQKKEKIKKQDIARETQRVLKEEGY